MRRQQAYSNSTKITAKPMLVNSDNLDIRRIKRANLWADDLKRTSPVSNCELERRRAIEVRFLGVHSSDPSAPEQRA